MFPGENINEQPDIASANAMGDAIDAVAANNEESVPAPPFRPAEATQAPPAKP